MYYGSIKPCDIANGTGVRVTLFVSGCTHRCKGCFQPQTWDFRYGQPFTAETEEALLEALNRPYISGLTLLGRALRAGQPAPLLPFLHRLRQQLPDKTVWAFSGTPGGADRAEPRPLRGHRRALPGGRWWMGNLGGSGTSPCAFAAPPTSGCWTSPPPRPPGGPSLGKAKQQNRPAGADPSLRPACFFSTASYIPSP
ncbi:MAG: 4Fe-4S single cluster domain-containing protein [Flavonifractor plautii]